MNIDPLRMLSHDVRRDTAALVRELRAMSTPFLTAAEKRRSIRANARSYARNIQSLRHGAENR